MVSAVAQWPASNFHLSVNESYVLQTENMGQSLVASGQYVHAIWSDLYNVPITAGAIFYRSSADGGQTWGQAINLSPSPYNDTFPLIAVCGSYVHVSFLRNSYTAQSTSYYRNSPDGGVTWNPEVLINQTEFWPGIACDGSYVYMSLNPLWQPGNTEVFFLSSADNGTTWSPFFQISNALGRSEDPAMSASGSYVYLVWNDNRSGTMETYYRRSTNRGGNWGNETALTQNPANTYTPTVSANGASVLVAYIDQSSGSGFTFLKQSSDYGSTFSAPVQLTNYSLSYPNLAQQGNNIHVIWGISFISHRGLVYLHSNDGGQTWGAPVILISNSVTVTESAIYVLGSVVHISWVDNRLGHYALFYMQNPTGNNFTGTTEGITGTTGIISQQTTGIISQQTTGIIYQQTTGIISQQTTTGIISQLTTSNPSHSPAHSSASVFCQASILVYLFLCLLNL